MPCKSLRHHDFPSVWCGETVEHCRACPSKCVLDEEIEIVWKWGVTDPDHYHADPKVISVTETLNCPLKAVLSRLVDYTESPKSLMPRAMGSLIHAELEKINPDEFAEIRMTTPLGGGYSLSGTADYASQDFIRDYKTMDALRKTVDTQHEDQLSIYHDMMGGPGAATRRLQIIQVTRKGMQSMDVDYNPEAFETCLSRARMMVAALEGDIELRDVPPAGRQIRHFRARHCDYCPVEIRERCEEIHPLTDE